MILCGMFGLQVAAQASQVVAQSSVFNFTYTGTDATNTASGTLTTGASDPSGSFFSPSLAITGITGTYNGAAITSLLPSGTYYQTSGFFGSPGNDNILYYPSTQSYIGDPTYLDRYGLGFSTSSGFVNIYFGLGGYGALYGTSLSDVTSQSAGTFTVTAASSAVPEPTVLSMFGLGVLLLGGFVGLRRRVG